MSVFFNLFLDMILKLYHYPISPNSRKVIAVLHHLSLACDYQVLDLSQREQLTPEFKALNPNHMIPTLVDDDFILWESNAIMQYLCTKVPNNTLWPLHDYRLQADINRWLFWQSGHFGNACAGLVFERLVKKAFNLGIPPDLLEIAKTEERFHRFAKVLERHLHNHEWLVGSSITLADLSVGSFLDLSEAASYPLTPYPEIKRWYKAIEDLPAWRSSAPANV